MAFVVCSSHKSEHSGGIWNWLPFQRRKPEEDLKWFGLLINDPKQEVVHSSKKKKGVFEVVCSFTQTGSWNCLLFYLIVFAPPPPKKGLFQLKGNIELLTRQRNRVAELLRLWLQVTTNMEMVTLKRGAKHEHEARVIFSVVPKKKDKGPGLVFSPAKKDDDEGTCSGSLLYLKRDHFCPWKHVANRALPTCSGVQMWRNSLTSSCPPPPPPNKSPICCGIMTTALFGGGGGGRI